MVLLPNHNEKMMILQKGGEKWRFTSDKLK